ncbi:UDP-N-acetylmuramate--L-alanine ligase [Escherichia coli]|nr:UDP-N-acetylmuramate--L-alanine ligase [Escherichia coli]
MNTQQLAKTGVPSCPKCVAFGTYILSASVVPVWAVLPKFLANEGYQISGSDLAPNPVTQQLMNLGATIYFNHRPENVRDASVVVVSSAISADNPEIVGRFMKRVFR